MPRPEADQPKVFVHDLHVAHVKLNRVANNMDSPSSPSEEGKHYGNLTMPGILDYTDLDAEMVRNPVKQWSGGMEIHIFQVGQGDSQLIIFPSGFTMLIDVCESAYNSKKGAILVAQKVKQILGHNKINVGSLSHWHLDHMGYVGYGGFWHLIEGGLLQFDKILDRDGGVWKGDKNGNGLCDLEEIKWTNAGTIGGTAEKWICYATDSRNEKIFAIREIAELSSTTQVKPPDNNAKVTVLLVNAIGVKQLNGELLTGDHHDAVLPPSENDYCIGFLIEFGSFVYVTAGDTDGEYTSSDFGYTYNNVEEELAKLTMKGTTGNQIDVLHANHHGSSHSSSKNYVETLKPQASFISCGFENSHGHPAQESLDRLLAVSDVYLPNLCEPEREYKSSIITNGDIVLRSANGDTFQINDGKIYTSRATLLKARPLISKL